MSLLESKIDKNIRKKNASQGKIPKILVVVVVFCPSINSRNNNHGWTTCLNKK